MNWYQNTQTGEIVNRQGKHCESLAIGMTTETTKKAELAKCQLTVMRDTNYTVEQASKITGVSRVKVLRFRIEEGLLN